MDQRAHDRDEKHEGDGQLIDLECHGCGEATHEDPLEEGLPDGSVISGAAQHAQQQDDAVDGSTDHHEHGEVGAPAVGAASTEEQDGRAQQWQGEQQPEVGEDPRGLCQGLDDGRDLSRVRQPSSAGPDHGASFLITSCPSLTQGRVSPPGRSSVLEQVGFVDRS